MSLLDVRPIVLITGISAAGKSTVADLLARRFTRGVHVRGDLYRRMIVTGREEMSAAPSPEAWRQLQLRYRLGAATAEAYHEAGFAVVVQDVIIGQVLTDYVARIRVRPLVVVVLAPRADVVAAREAQRPKVAYSDTDDAITISSFDAVHRAETPRIGMWLDTSDQTPEETVEAIIASGLEHGGVTP